MSNQKISSISAPSATAHARPAAVGLTTAEVKERVDQGLQNNVSSARSKQITEILAENFFSVFNLIVALIVGTMLIFYLRTGDIRLPLDAIGVLGVAVINTTLAVVQEIRAKRALDKVNLLLKHTAQVVRDGRLTEIDQSEIVVGDLIALTRGDQIVVDGRIETANHLEIDESLLTGESVPIEKAINNAVLSGSFCVAGNGFYVAEKVGDSSYAAKITSSAKQFKLYLTPLQRRLARLVQILFVTSIALVALEVFFGTNQDLSQVDLVRKLSTFVISLVPHGLVLMSSITFALGVYRISQLGAIVQKLNAIESFANVKVVCMDKTGTLTQNKLSIKHVTRIDESVSQLEAERLLGLYGELSTDKNATLRTLEKFAPAAAEFLRERVSVKLIDEVPFTSDLKMSLIEVELNDEREIFILGGFDVLNARIGVRGMRGKSEDLLRELQLGTYRNLLFGRVLNSASLGELKKDFEALRVDPLCIISIVDEVRTDVLEAIKLFQLHNVELKILSGDAAESVQSVAHEIGWHVSPQKIIVGAELDALKEEEFAQAAREKVVFARLTPEHKLRLVQSLRRQKFYTAMIGDGVNDLPAIKEADLGIAMEEGSAITKEIADIVLLKNKFALLPSIFDEGNRIVNTISLIAKLFLTKNLFVIYLALAGLLINLSFPLTPRRVSLISFFTIALPSLAIALKNRDASKTRHFTLDLFTYVLLSGFFVCAAGFAAEFAAARYFSADELEIQMNMFAVMTIVAAANFFVVTFSKPESSRKTYLLYSAGIVALFVFLATTPINFFPIRLVKTFCEINRIDSRFWGMIAIISLLSTAALFVVQKVRNLIIKK